MLKRYVLLVALVATASSSQRMLGQGLITPGSGAMHRSMGGASTAAAVDAAGALYWNPATISGLPHSEVVIGSELLLPDTHLGSTVPAGAFGPFGPDATQSGYTRSDSGLVPLTAVGVVYKPEDSQITYGLNIATLAAGGTNYPGSATNPLLAPTGPLNQFILGPQASSLTVLSIQPTFSLQLTDRLAVGGGPMADVSVVSFDPAFFGPTSQLNPLAPRQFPTGSHTRPFWGGGFRAGATFKITDHLTSGLSYTSPQWFETWRFNARDASGNPFTFRTQFSLPQIVSGGLSYDGVENLLVSADVRYFDYRTTDLIGEPVRQGGANWDNIWSVAAGAKYQLNERLSVQLGYLFNENPVPSDLALFNTQLPSLTKHTVSAGTYVQLNESIGMSLAYVHGFKNSISGTVFQVIGATTTLDTEYDSIAFGLHIKFGGPRCAQACAPQASAPCGLPGQ